MTKIIGIAIDSWKLPIFKKHLDQDGYVFTEHPGLTEGTLLLKVKTDFVHTLQPLIKAANDECKRNKMQ